MRAPAPKAGAALTPPNPLGRNTAPGRNTDLDTTLVQSNPSNPVYAQISFPDLKKRIDTAISEAGITRPDGTVVSIHAVSHHASKDLIITANSRVDMNLLRNSPSWLTAFSDKLSIRKAIYPVIVHRISTTLDPSAPEAIAELKADNPGALTSVTRIMWANPKKALTTGSEKKNHSSIIMHLTNPIEANNLIQHFCVLRGETHPTEKSRRSLISCHRCTNWGHTAARCSAPTACARCAGKHLTVNCNCTEPEATKCTDHYSCSHIVTCCPQYARGIIAHPPMNAPCESRPKPNWTKSTFEMAPSFLFAYEFNKRQRTHQQQHPKDLSMQRPPRSRSPPLPAQLTGNGTV